MVFDILELLLAEVVEDEMVLEGGEDEVGVVGGF